MCKYAFSRRINFLLQDRGLPSPCHNHAADQYITCSPETWNIMTFVTKIIVPYHNWFAPLHIIFDEIRFNLFSSPRPGLPVVFKNRSFIHTSCRLFRLHIQSCQRGLDNAVGIATSYGLEHPGIESNLFSITIHTWPGAHPASCPMRNGQFFPPWIKQPGHVSHLHPSRDRG